MRMRTASPFPSWCSQECVVTLAGLLCPLGLCEALHILPFALEVFWWLQGDYLLQVASESIIFALFVFALAFGIVMVSVEG